MPHPSSVSVPCSAPSMQYLLNDKSFSEWKMTLKKVHILVLGRYKGKQNEEGKELIHLETKVSEFSVMTVQGQLYSFISVGNIFPDLTLKSKGSQQTFQ